VQTPSEPLASKLNQRLCQRITQARVDVPVGADHEQPSVGERPREELQKQKGRRVRRVEVIENEHDRLGQRCGAEERAGRLEQAEAGTFRVSEGRNWKLAVELGQLGKDLHEVRGSAAELAAEQLGIAISHIRAKRLYPRPVGRRAAGLPAASDEDVDSVLPGAIGELLDEPALADAGLAADQEEAALAGKRLVETMKELAQLSVAADEQAKLSRCRCFEEGTFYLESARQL
jgi:hypothetical protein